MGWVSGIVTFLFVIVSILMTFLILLQEGKGGGLAALGGTKAAGIEGVSNPIRRATGYLAGIFFTLAIMLGVLNRPTKGTKIDFEAEAPKTEVKAELPATENPSIGAPVPVVPPAPAAPAAVEVKKAEEPKVDETKKAEEPKKDEPKKEEPKAEAPAAPAPAPAAPAAAPAPAPAAPAPAPAAEPKAEEKKAP